MKNLIGRREFLRLGSMGAATLAMGVMTTGCGSDARSEDEGFAAQESSFLIDPNNFAKLNIGDKTVENISPLVLYGFDSVAINPCMPLISSAELVERISQKMNGDACIDPTKNIAKVLYDGERVGQYPLGLFMEVQATSQADMMDVAAESVISVSQYRKIDLGIEFLHQDIYRSDSSEKQLPVQVIYDAEKKLQKGSQPHVELFGWRFQVRGPDFDQLGTCVRQKVPHVHLEIFHNRNYVVNFHIGVYKEGKKRCFVLWNNIKPYTICWKSCSSNKKTLTDMMKWVIVAAAAVAGVYVAAFIVAAIAESLAVALLPVLAVL